jgi:Tfp pilus assembly protein PilW
MLVTIAIFSIIVAVLFGSVQFFYQSNAYALEQAVAVDSARRGVELLVRDLREATLADDGAYTIISMGSTTLEFYSDIDGDDSVERVRFILVDGTLYKAVTNASGNPPQYLDINEATSTAAQDVRNDDESTPVFEYFDSSGVEITNYGDVVNVVFVRVNLIVNVNPNRLPREFTLRSSATLRNLKPD